MKRNMLWAYTSIISFWIQGTLELFYKSNYCSEVYISHCKKQQKDFAETLYVSFENGYNNRKEIYNHYFVNGAAHVQLISVPYWKF